jgi:protein-S-isoprenylcysteine O-methyltransferase Ste14
MGYSIVPETIVSRIGGLFITIAGVGFAMWARIHLGEHWSNLPSIHQEHELIRTGPYRYVRHPIYAGLILGLKGSLVVVNQVWMLVLVLLVITGLVLKIWDEEMILMDEFGEDYLQYKKQAKVLIPFIL